MPYLVELRLNFRSRTIDCKMQPDVGYETYYLQANLYLDDDLIDCYLAYLVRNRQYAISEDLIFEKHFGSSEGYDEINDQANIDFFGSIAGDQVTTDLKFVKPS